MTKLLDSKYERAKKRVKTIKGFYSHLKVFFVINTLLLVSKTRITLFALDQTGIIDSRFLDWIDWNIFGTLIVWTFILIIHGYVVFGKKPSLLKNWEEQQLQKFIEQDKTNQGNS